MQRQLIGELNTQPTTHHVSLLEITPQRNCIWSWKPKTALTPDSILCFIISQWLWMLFMTPPPTHTPYAEKIGPKGILSKGTLKSYSCHSARFTLTSRVGQLGRKTWPEHRYSLSVSFGAMTPRWLLDQKFSKKLPHGQYTGHKHRLMHTAIPLLGLLFMGQERDMTLGQGQINKDKKDLVATVSPLFSFLENEEPYGCQENSLLQANFLWNCWGKCWPPLSSLLGNDRHSSQTSPGHCMNRQVSLQGKYQYAWEKQRKK